MLSEGGVPFNSSAQRVKAPSQLVDYTPALNQNGPNFDNFTYTLKLGEPSDSSIVVGSADVGDLVVDSAEAATITVSVAAVEDLPTASSASYEVAEDTLSRIDLFISDVRRSTIPAPSYLPFSSFHQS